MKCRKNTSYIFVCLAFRLFGSNSENYGYYFENNPTWKEPSPEERSVVDGMSLDDEIGPSVLSCTAAYPEFLSEEAVQGLSSNDYISIPNCVVQWRYSFLKSMLQKDFTSTCAQTQVVFVHQMKTGGITMDSFLKCMTLECLEKNPSSCCITQSDKPGHKTWCGLKSDESHSHGGETNHRLKPEQEENIGKRRMHAKIDTFATARPTFPEINWPGTNLSHRATFAPIPQPSPAPGCSIYLSVFREPLSRLHSLYAFKQQSNAPYRAHPISYFLDCANRSITEKHDPTADEPDCGGYHEFTNHMTTFAANAGNMAWRGAAGWRWVYERAKRNLLSRFHIVGVTDRFQSPYEQIYAKLPFYYRNAAFSSSGVSSSSPFLAASTKGERKGHNHNHGYGTGTGTGTGGDGGGGHRRAATTAAGSGSGGSGGGGGTGGVSSSEARVELYLPPLSSIFPGLGAEEEEEGERKDMGSIADPSSPPPPFPPQPSQPVAGAKGTAAHSGGRRLGLKRGAEESTDRGQVRGRAKGRAKGRAGNEEVEDREVAVEAPPWSGGYVTVYIGKDRGEGEGKDGGGAMDVVYPGQYIGTTTASSTSNASTTSTATIDKATTSGGSTTPGNTLPPSDVPMDLPPRPAVNESPLDAGGIHRSPPSSSSVPPPYLNPYPSRFAQEMRRAVAEGRPCPVTHSNPTRPVGTEADDDGDGGGGAVGAGQKEARKGGRKGVGRHPRRLRREATNGAESNIGRHGKRWGRRRGRRYLKQQEQPQLQQQKQQSQRRLRTQQEQPRRRGEEEDIGRGRGGGGGGGGGSTGVASTEFSANEIRWLYSLNQYDSGLYRLARDVALVDEVLTNSILFDRF